MLIESNWRDGRWWCARRNRCRSSAWCEATSRDRAGKIMRRPGKSAALNFRPACRNPSACWCRFLRQRPRQPRVTTKIFRSSEQANYSERNLATRVRAVSIDLYQRAAAYTKPRGILLADTKFEFGLLDGQLIWIDEALTPDSSRFWPAAQYQPGGPQPSFDKQFVRDYLESIGWNKMPPGPELPAEVVAATRANIWKPSGFLPGTSCGKTEFIQFRSTGNQFNRRVLCSDRRADF